MNTDTKSLAAPQFCKFAALSFLPVERNSDV